MSEQRQHDRVSEAMRPHANGDDAAVGADKLAATRAELNDVYAQADAILDGIRQGDSQLFLEQMRQRGGQ